MNEYSPYALGADDPPVYLLYNQPPAIRQEQKDPTHAANFGVMLKDLCGVAGIECGVQYPNAPDIKHETTTDYLIATLKRNPGAREVKIQKKRPNILFIGIDDLRPELGCYGADHIKSPNMDNLAKKGVLFNRTYCQAPHCAPSRSSLLSVISTIDYEGIHFKPEELAPGKITLPAVFREAGGQPIIVSSVTRRTFDQQGKIVSQVIRNKKYTFKADLTAYANAA